MPWILSSVEATVGALVVLIAVIIAVVWFRRRRIAAGGPLIVCALRTPAEPRWRLGLLRLTEETLDWFSVVGATTRSEFSWSRRELDFGAPQPLSDHIPGLPDPYIVNGTAAGAALDLALPRSGGTVLRAWLESSPPGFNVNVA
ncbi:MAG: DUF2550 family protein [Nostocoides sp.]